MQDTRLGVAEPLLHEAVPRGARCTSKVKALGFLFLGLGCLFLGSGSEDLTVQEPGIAMATQMASAPWAQRLQATPAVPKARMASMTPFKSGTSRFPHQVTQAFKQQPGGWQSMHSMKPVSAWQFNGMRPFSVRAEGEEAEQAPAPEDSTEQAPAAEDSTDATEPATEEPAVDTGEAKGTLLRWNQQKGFGFIKPEKGGDDVFVHVSALMDGEGSVREGDAVSYVMEFDDRSGKDRAVDVIYAGEARAPIERLNGTLMNWNNDKGFGFIRPEGAARGKDIFCHVSSLVRGPGSVNSGDNVTYISEFNERKGQTQAVRVLLFGDNEPPPTAPSERKPREPRAPRAEKPADERSFGYGIDPNLVDKEFASLDPNRTEAEDAAENPFKALAALKR